MTPQQATASDLAVLDTTVELAQSLRCYVNCIRSYVSSWGMVLYVTGSIHICGMQSIVSLLTPYTACTVYILNVHSVDSCHSFGHQQMTLNCTRHAGERRWHVTIPLAISSLALACMAHTMEHSPSLAFLSLLVATLAWAPNGIMYSYPATFLQGAAAATGVALINSIANVGGMIGPYLIGGYLV